MLHVSGEPCALRAITVSRRQIQVTRFIIRGRRSYAIPAQRAVVSGRFSNFHSDGARELNDCLHEPCLLSSSPGVVSPLSPSPEVSRLKYLPASVTRFSWTAPTVALSIPVSVPSKMMLTGKTLLSYLAGQSSNAANYAQQCYSASTSRTFDCTTFVEPRLPTTVDNGAPCPFADNMCRSNDSNIRLNTGYIDTREHLGINSPQDQKILFRGTLECAPLITQGFSEDVTLSEAGNFTRYFYGKTVLYNTTGNFTDEAPSVESQYINISATEDHFVRRGLYPVVA